MRPDSRDSILAAIEQTFIQAGAKDYDSGMAQCERLLAWLQEHYRPMRSKQDLAALLNGMPEPNAFAMRLLLGGIRYAPQLIRYGLKELSSQAEDTLPEIPRGRPGLDVFSKAQIVAHIGKRHTAGYSLDQAKKSTVRRFNVSESTVQRAWDDRGNRDAVDFRSVLKFLADNSADDNDILDSPTEPVD